MTSEAQRREEYVQSQNGIEELARRAHNVRTAVTLLNDAFVALCDRPDPLDELMSRLTTVAGDVADLTVDWAQISDVEFDPSSNRQQ